MKWILILFAVLMTEVWTHPARGNEKPQKLSKEIAMVVDDSVHKLEKVTGGYRVFFKLHSGVYYLKPESKHFDVILSALKTSQKTGEKLVLKADVNSMEIIELKAN